MRATSEKSRGAGTRRRLYFAHAVCVYGSEEEKFQLAQIRMRLRPDLILNPADYRDHPEKLSDSMSFCFKLIELCDMVVFTRLLGKITSGVGKEVNYALGLGKKVYELKGTRLVPIRRPVRFIPREDTRLLYRAWRRPQPKDDGPEMDEFF